MSNKKEQLIIFAITFIINLPLIFIFILSTTKNINTFIRFTSYDYECVGIFDDVYNNDNSFKKSKSFYRISAEETAFSYLYFEKDVDYKNTPNITKSNSKINKLQSNECAISLELARLIKVNIGGEIKIDISANEYIYKVVYLYDTDYSFYNSKTKDIYDVVLGENDDISSNIEYQEILFCDHELLINLSNNDMYSIRSVTYLKSEIINSIIQNYMILIFVIIIGLIDFVIVKIILYSKKNDYLIDFYSNVKIAVIKKNYIKYYFNYHLLPCGIAVFISFVLSLILKINCFIVLLYLLTITIIFIINYGGFSKLWKKKY